MPAVSFDEYRQVFQGTPEGAGNQWALEEWRGWPSGQPQVSVGQEQGPKPPLALTIAGDRLVRSRWGFDAQRWRNQTYPAVGPDPPSVGRMLWNEALLRKIHRLGAGALPKGEGGG